MSELIKVARTELPLGASKRQEGGVGRLRLVVDCFTACSRCSKILWIRITRIACKQLAPVAQLAEQLTLNQ